MRALNPSELDQVVNREDLEHQLEFVRARAPSGREGVFGPASMIWQVDREAAIFLGAGRALLLQLAHPWVAAAISQHSQVIGDPIGRFHRTFGTVFSMVFGTIDQALAASRRLHERHAAIEGDLPAAAGCFAAGSRYQANDVAALLWVHATLTDTALLAYDSVLPALTREQREAYYTDNQLFAALFAIPHACLPPDWTAFTSYIQAMWDSDTLTVSPVARALADQLLSGAGSWLCSPQWYCALTAQMLPPRLREGFGLCYGIREQGLADRALTWLGRIYPLLPARLRYVGPYQEAQARLSGRVWPDIGTQMLNRLWIGRSELR
jgi:uncharacterized protein (DUF2236 family)